MLDGYTGHLLKADLSTRSLQIHDIDPDEMRPFIGGGGYNAWLLYQAVARNKEINPLGPENPLIFGAGPLVGTPFPTAARCSFTALSPLTGIFGESNGGGLTGVAVKKSGFDHLLITGASEKPCVLVIGGPDECRIEDAGDLWGLETHETEARLLQKYPKAVVMVIGPAGEQQVRYASIISCAGGNVFGRAGMGAVMGSKRLKAIVALGGKGITVNDAPKLKKMTRKILQDVATCSLPILFRRHGTAMLLNMLVARGLMYGKNWCRKIFPGDIESIDIGAYYDATQSKSHGCFKCPLTCKRKWKIKAGPHQGEEGHGFEIAHILSFGLTLGIRDVSVILHLIEACNRMGFDLIEFAGTVGMAIDSYQQGFLSKAAADGLPLDWNAGPVVETLIQKVARREGLGDILAEGTRQAARAIGPGAEMYALHMKGMHWPAHSAPPFALAFSLSPRGGNLKGLPHLLMQNRNAEVIRKLFDGTAETRNIYTHGDKGRAVWWHENYKILLDGLGTCFWLSVMLLPYGSLFADELAQVCTAVTGLETDGAEMIRSAERVYQIERAINTMRGMTRKDDSFTRRPEPDSWGHGIDLNVGGMLDEYYGHRGLSPEGLPTRRRLEEIQLKSVADTLETTCLLGESRSCLPMSTIVKNPSGKAIARSLVARIISKIQRRVMKKLEDPLYYRRFFENQNRKIQKRALRTFLRKYIIRTSGSI